MDRGRVLLVDDEPLILEMFESVLRDEGYDVYVASNAKEALQQLDRTVFDVLVCDVRLEDLDGFDIMAIARKRFPAIGVVLITGAPSTSDAQIALEQSATYLSKPIGFDLLVEAVENAPDIGAEVTKKRAQA
jgi:DNA-binding NtrC family response regulator